MYKEPKPKKRSLIADLKRKKKKVRCKKRLFKSYFVKKRRKSRESNRKKDYCSKKTKI